MFTKTNIQQAIGAEVDISAPMLEALTKWVAIYGNQAEWLGKDVKSLNLAAAIASEIARLVTIEMKVTVTGSLRADYLNEVLASVVEKMRDMVEFGAAKGGLMMKPYIKNKKIVIDFIHADRFYPVSYDNDQNITAAVFTEVKKVGAYWFTRLEFHSLTDAGYVIENMAYKSSSENVLGSQVLLSSVSGWDELAESATITGIDRPLFAYFKYPAANFIDPASPLGVSCFARGIDLIQEADRQWSRLLWEFESGERALYVDELAFKKDETTGLPKLPNKRLYKTLSTSGQIGKDEFFKEWTPTLREMNILNGLDAILRRLEFTVGLAYGTLSNPDSVDKTATEIVSAKQRSASTVVDVQKSLKTSLDDLTYAVDVWTTIGKLAPKGKYNSIYDFDDSLVTDATFQFNQDSRTVAMGGMPLSIFVERNYKLSTEDAIKWVQQAKAERSVDIFNQ